MNEEEEDEEEDNNDDDDQDGKAFSSHNSSPRGSYPYDYSPRADKNDYFTPYNTRGIKSAPPIKSEVYRPPPTSIPRDRALLQSSSSSTAIRPTSSGDSSSSSSYIRPNTTGNVGNVPKASSLLSPQRATKQTGASIPRQYKQPITVARRSDASIKLDTVNKKLSGMSMQGNFVNTNPNNNYNNNNNNNNNNIYNNNNNLPSPKPDPVPVQPAPIEKQTRRMYDGGGGGGGGGGGVVKQQQQQQHKHQQQSPSGSDVAKSISNIQSNSNQIRSSKSRSGNKTASWIREDNW